MMALSPDGTKLAPSSFSTLGVEIWERKTGRQLYSLPERAGTVYFLAWNADNSRLAMARSSGSIEIWNLPEIKRVVTTLGLGLSASSKE